MDQNAEKPYSKVYFFTVAICLMLVNLNNQLSRWLLAFLQPQLMHDLNMNKSQYGFAAGYGFSLVFLVF
eukprot:Pgem_evm1s16861